MEKKANNENVTFPAQFRLGSVSNRFNNTESSFSPLQFH